MVDPIDSVIKVTVHFFFFDLSVFGEPCSDINLSVPVEVHLADKKPIGFASLAIEVVDVSILIAIQIDLLFNQAVGCGTLRQQGLPINAPLRAAQPSTSKV